MVAGGRTRQEGHERWTMRMDGSDGIMWDHDKVNPSLYTTWRESDEGKKMRYSVE